MSPRRRKKGKGLLTRLKGLLVMLVLVAVCGFFARVTLAGLSGAADFTVEEIRVEGTRYLDPSEILDYSGVDDLEAASMTPEDLERLGERVATHPFVARVSVRRSLPAAVVIDVTERVPVAFLAGSPITGVDAEGTVMERIETARYGALPFITGLPTGTEARTVAIQRAVRALLLLQDEAPRLADTVSEIRPRTGDEIALVLIPDGVRVRLDAGRLSETAPLVGALVAEGRKRHGSLGEVDLRYRDSVIYRQREGGE